MEDIISKLNFPLALDGGLSNILSSYGLKFDKKLWTAGFLITNPEAVEKVHLDYLKAGAQCISTASYQATIEGFMASGLTEEKSEQLIKFSVTLAENARNQFLQTRTKKGANLPLIAASLGPYGAFLADGSEYTGLYNSSRTDLFHFHKRRFELMLETPADIIAFETIPNKSEVEVICDLSTNSNKPLWISFSCKDSNYLHDGSSLDEVVSMVNNFPSIFAIGANCYTPSLTSDLIKNFKTLTSKKIIVYPNSGEQYDPIEKVWKPGTGLNHIESAIESWIDLGADMVGGCCQLGTDFITRVSNVIDRR